jgi:hypothetical protein
MSTVGATGKLRIGALIALVAIVISACASRSATITGTLAVGDGACVYVRVPDAGGTDTFWVRSFPPGYSADENGLVRPDGNHIRVGDSVTVSGALTFDLRDGNCASAHALDASTIK